MRLMMMRNVMLLTACLAWCLPPCATAQVPAAPKEAVQWERLQIGDTPPPLAPMAWVKGEPVKAFERGHVYVVAFFATWCGASRQSMPVLSNIARHHADQLTVIGVNVRQAERGEATVEAVTAFARERGADMDYTVSMDDPVRTPMFNTWMRGAGMYAIPTAFIIGRDGKLAYVGIPIDPDASYPFGKAVEQALAGTSDLAAARKLQGELREQMVAYLKDRALMQPLDDAAARKDWRGMLAEADRLVAQDPQLEGRVFAERLLARLSLDEADALAFARQTRANAKDPQMIQGISSTIGTVIAYQPDLSRDAYAFAATNLEAALASGQPEYFAMMDLMVLAQVRHRLGERDAAIQAQQKSVAIARGRTDIPGEMMDRMEKTLAEYRAVAVSPLP